MKSRPRHDPQARNRVVLPPSARFVLINDRLNPIAKLVWLVLAVTPGILPWAVAELLDLTADEVLTALADLAEQGLATRERPT